MPEKLYTPSDEFSNQSMRRDVEQGIALGERRLNVLDSLEAAKSAKPYMDVAVDLFNAYQENEDQYAMNNIVEESPGLSSLVVYAELKANEAVEKGIVSDIKGPEEEVLSAYRAEAIMEQAQAKCDYDKIDLEDLRQAAEEAYTRSRNAKGTEKVKWQQLEGRLIRFSDYLSGDQDNEIRKEFHADTNRAGVVLDEAVRTGKVGPTEYISIADVRQDANFMKGRAEMYEFLAEVYPKHKGESGYKGLTPEAIVAAREQVEKMMSEPNKIVAETGEHTVKKSIVPDERMERSKFVKQYFSEHVDTNGETNVDVLRDYVVKQVRDELLHAKKQGMRAKDNISLIFRLGTFNDANLDSVQPEQRFAYRLLASTKPELTFSDFDAMSVDELATALGVDIRKEITDYDQLIKHMPSVKREFPYIDTI
jgi:hypothetical protein